MSGRTFGRRPDSCAAPPAVLRFAPSPTGRLHIGHAASALWNEHLALRLGGRLLLRIEDIDPERCRDHFVAGILEDLAWLGIAFDGPVIVQSENLAAHIAAADRLRAAGLLYPCFATRREIAEVARHDEAPLDPDGSPIYPGLWRDRAPTEVAAAIATGAPCAWRLHMRRALEIISRPGEPRLTWTSFEPDGHLEERLAQPERWGDVVLQRKDVPTSYHLAVVTDDAAAGITHVVRGKDLEAATDLHMLLYRLLRETPPLWHHHELILAGDGRKLGKRYGDAGLDALRARGVMAERLRAELGFAPEA